MPAVAGILITNFEMTKQGILVLKQDGLFKRFVCM